MRGTGLRHRGSASVGVAPAKSVSGSPASSRSRHRLLGAAAALVAVIACSSIFPHALGQLTPINSVNLVSPPIFPALWTDAACNPLISKHHHILYIPYTHIYMPYKANTSGPLPTIAGSTSRLFHQRASPAPLWLSATMSQCSITTSQ